MALSDLSYLNISRYKYLSQGFNSVMHSNNFTAGDLFIKFVLFNFSFYLIALLKILKVGSISFYTLDI